MPISAVGGGNFLCLHAGIGPNIQDLDSINAINRFQEIPDEGDMCDILWSDPCETSNAVSKEFEHNDKRGCSYYFGLEPLKNVLKKTKCKMLIRAHEVVLDGYKCHQW